MAERKSDPNWVVVDWPVQDGEDWRFYCRRCKAQLRPKLPIEMRALAKIGRGFIAIHSECTEANHD